jgi:hypothetical protein
MTTRTNALLSQQETGKITASIIPVAAGCHPVRYPVNQEGRFAVPDDLQCAICIL